MHTHVQSTFAFHPRDQLPHWKGGCLACNNSRHRAGLGNEMSTEMCDRDMSITRNKQPGLTCTTPGPCQRRGMPQPWRFPTWHFPPGKLRRGGRRGHRAVLLARGLCTNRKAAGAEAGGAAALGNAMERDGPGRGRGCKCCPCMAQTAG